MLEKFENRIFTLKMLQWFSIQSTPEKFENATIILNLSYRKTKAGKLHDYFDIIFFEKLYIQNQISVHTTTKGKCFQIPLV